MNEKIENPEDSNKICTCSVAVKWNSYNKVVQCHQCGQIFKPQQQIINKVEVKNE